MSGHKNIFMIARRRAHNDEDQLTELLAYLLQETPRLTGPLLSDFGFPAAPSSVTTQSRFDGGRLDLEFHAAGELVVVVESKLGSKTTFEQCEKYVRHLATKEEPIRGLVLLTKLHEPWPQGISELADDCGVQLVARRWWDVTLLLRQAETSLAVDFAELLEEEGIVVPGPLTDEDWVGEGIPPAAVALVIELKSGLRKLTNGHGRVAIYDGRGELYRSIYSRVKSGIEIGLAVAATWDDFAKHRHVQPKSICPPIEGSVIASFVRDHSRSESDWKTAAKEAIEVSDADRLFISHGTCPGRATSAASVLSAPDFLGQVERALEYARETAEHFRQIGYLKWEQGERTKPERRPNDSEI